MKSLVRFSAILCFIVLSLSQIQAQVEKSFTQNGAGNFLNQSCYSVFRKQLPFGLSFLMFANIASDDAKTGGGAADYIPDIQAYDSFKVLSSNQYIQHFWEKYYAGITNCNILLDYATEGASTEIDRNRAEARFMRAFFYFDLVRLFGGVPLHINSDMPLIPNLPRSSKTEVYTQIENDLLAAIPDLPVKSSLAADEKYRISKGAAQSLLGKVYLYQEKWQEAADQFETVINSGQYNLMARFSDLWVTANKNSVESVLEFSYSTDNDNWVEETGNPIPMIVGIRNIDGTNSDYRPGWGFCPVTEDLVNAFLAEGDSIRLKSTIIDEDTLTKLGYAINTSNVNSDYTGYYDNKHTALTDDFAPGSLCSDKNEIVIRFADVLLMAAEAQCQLNNTINAQQYLSRVRSRVGLPEINSTGGALLEAIRKERRLELALEANRYYDLIRWGQAASVLSGIGYSAYNDLWPIPQFEIDKNVNLTQNAGYNATIVSSGSGSNYNNSLLFNYYKPTLDSLINYQYNFALTDSLPLFRIKFKKRPNQVMDIWYSFYDMSINSWKLTHWAIDSLNEAGKLKTEILYSYNFALSSDNSPYWDTIKKYQYSYNIEGYQTSSKTFIWGRYKVMNVWSYGWFPQQTFYDYPDAMGNDTLISFQQFNPTTGTYKTYILDRYLHYYGSDELPDSIIYYSTNYNADTTSFEKVNKYEYKYDSHDNQIQSDEYYWNSTSYMSVLSDKKNYTYNTDNYIVSQVYQVLNQDLGLYENKEKTIYLLDDLNRTSVKSIYSHHIGFEDWWIGDGKYRTFYYYSETEPVENIHSSENNSAVSIWPNPVSGNSVTVEYNLSQTGKVQIQLISMEGKTVLAVPSDVREAGQNQTELDLTNISSGIYLIKIAIGENIYTQKIVIMNNQPGK